MSLVDFAQSNPALPLGHPFQGVSNQDYSTATLTQTGTDRNDRVVIFNVGPGQTDTGLVIDPRGVWCVRGGSHILPNFSSARD